MRVYNKKNINAEGFSELQKNIDGNQSIRKKNTVCQILTGDIVSENEINVMKNDLVQRIFGCDPQLLYDIVDEKVNATTVTIAPLKKNFKEELKNRAKFFSQLRDQEKPVNIKANTPGLRK